MDLLSDLSEALRPFSDLQSMSLSSSSIGGIAVAVCVTRFLPLMGYRGNAFPLRGGQLLNNKTKRPCHIHVS